MKGWTVKRPSKGGVRYQAKVRVPDPSRPKGYRDVSQTFATKKEAESWLARTVADLERGTLVLPDTATVADLLDLWLDGVVRQRVSRGSFVDYERYVRVHLKPGLGHVRVQKLTPVVIQSWYRERLEAGVSASTMHGCHVRFRNALESAVDWGVIPSNPCDRVHPPATAPRRFPVWSPEQGASFLCATEGRRHHALWVVALATGMRLGEMLGLRWQDVDLEGRTVTVSHQLRRSGDGWVAAPLKTGASRRTIALPSEAAAALRAHRLRQLEARLRAGGRWREMDVVFATSIGTPFNDRTVREAFHRDVAAAGVPAIRIHDMRHSHATWLLQAGVPVKTVSDRLGHASARMTLDRYAHVIPGMQERAAEVVQDVLFGAG